MENWLLKAKNEVPYKIAVKYKNQEINYKILYDKSIMYAKKMHGLGIQPGDNVGIHISASLEYIYLIYALMELGAVMVPLNTGLANLRKIQQLQHVDVKRVISDTYFEGFNCISLTELENSKESILSSRKTYEPQSLQSIIFTSGTTGEPKGVQLNYENHYSSALSSAEVLDKNDNDVWLNCISLFHVGGLEIVFRSCIYQTAFVLHQGFKVEDIVKSLREDLISIVSFVPTMLRKVLEIDQLQNIPSLRIILLGGAKTSTKLVRLSQELNLPIALTYGMTEGCSQIATAHPQLVSKYPESVGYPLPGVQVQIKKQNKDFGEIWVRGPNISKGYYKHEELNRRVFKDGFFNTGDLGYLDDGVLYVVNRRKDLIVSGGENVLPSEVETVIRTIGEIEDVIVFGVEDELWGQKVVAAIIGSPNITTKVIHTSISDLLAPYKIPKQFYLVDFFPRTQSGKVIREKVKEMCAIMKPLL